MKFQMLFTSVALAATETAGTIEDGKPCGLEAAKVTSKGGCKSEKAKCDAVPKTAVKKDAARRMLAEDAKAEDKKAAGTCTAAQAICRAKSPAADAIATAIKTAETACPQETTAACKWVAVADKGTCEADCKCTVSGTTVVSASVAFVAAIFLL